MTTTDLLNDIAANIASGGVGGVTAAKLRGVLNDIVNSNAVDKTIPSDLTGLMVPSKASLPVLVAVPATAGTVNSALHGCYSGQNYQATATATQSAGAVNTVTVTNSGLAGRFWEPPTCTIVDPTGSGAVLAAHLKAAVAYPAAGGSGYAVGDTLGVTGDTGTQAVFTITSISGGGGTGPVTGITITTAGSLTVTNTGTPNGNPRSTSTSGSGTGCTLSVYYSITSISITSGGTGYTAPTVAIGQAAAVPDIWVATLQCQTAENGYSIGDEVEISSVLSSVGSLYNKTLSLSVDSKSFYVTRQNGGNLLIYHKTTGNLPAMTAANWKVAFRAFNLS